MNTIGVSAKFWSSGTGAGSTLGQVELFAFGFPLVLELAPGVPAAPVFFDVKQGDQTNQAGATRRNWLKNAPATEPAASYPQAY